MKHEKKRDDINISLIEKKLSIQNLGKIGYYSILTLEGCTNITTYIQIFRLSAQLAEIQDSMRHCASF